MRVWDIEPKYLCRQHLLGEHRELHAVWKIITGNKRGYSAHPETKRWRGRLAALFARHRALVREMSARNYKHFSDLDEKLSRGAKKQTVFINTLAEQKEILRQKPCGCFIHS